MLTYPAGLMIQTMVWAFAYFIALCVSSNIIWNQLLYVRNGGNMGTNNGVGVHRMDQRVRLWNLSYNHP